MVLDAEKLRQRQRVTLRFAGRFRILYRPPLFTSDDAATWTWLVVLHSDPSSPMQSDGIIGLTAKAGFTFSALENHFPRGIGSKYLGTITFVFGEATAISFKKDCRASSAGC